MDIINLQREFFIILILGLSLTILFVGENVATAEQNIIQKIDSNLNLMFITSPLKQLKSGIPTNDIECESGLVLVIKKNDSPACIKKGHVNALLERRWAITIIKEFSGNPEHSSIPSEYANNTEIKNQTSQSVQVEQPPGNENSNSQLQTMLSQLQIYEPIKPIDEITDSNNNMILWEKDHILQWSDFKGTLNETAPEVAYASWSIQYKYSFFCFGTLPTLQTNVTQIKVGAFFNTLSSGVKNNTINQYSQSTKDYVLKHEQGHFDLAELYARQIYYQMINESGFMKYSCEGDTMSEKISDGKSKLDQRFVEIFNKSFKDLAQAEQEYDLYTNHDANVPNQNTYNQFFNNLR